MAAEATTLESSVSVSANVERVSVVFVTANPVADTQVHIYTPDEFKPQSISALAAEAREERRQGKTTPLEDFLAEQP
jgi:hypothetical protein